MNFQTIAERYKPAHNSKLGEALKPLRAMENEYNDLKASGDMLRAAIASAEQAAAAIAALGNIKKLDELITQQQRIPALRAILGALDGQLAGALERRRRAAMEANRITSILNLKALAAEKAEKVAKRAAADLPRRANADGTTTEAARYAAAKTAAEWAFALKELEAAKTEFLL